MAVLKNGAREDINLPPTSRAQPAVTTPFPNVLAAAGRTLKSLWKPKRKQILPARFVISEAFFKFNQRFRIVLTHIPYLYVGGWWRQGNTHDLKNIFKGAATRAAAVPGPFQDFHAALVARGMKPTMARLTLARKIAAITLIVWKKGVGFDAEHLKQQAA